jgi:HTH-type transcriptional regulator / antitoxin HipB
MNSSRSEKSSVRPGRLGLTQEELADRVHTKKTAISRIENHAEDIKISTLKRVAKALGKRIQINLV